MKKIVALLLMVSFVTVNTTGAFAAQSLYGRGRVSGRVEHRNTDRRTIAGRPGSPLERRLTNRSNPLDRRSITNRPLRRNNDFFNRSRPATRYNSNFYNRSRFFNRRPIAPQYRYRPYYSGHSHSSSSLTALEFLGLGAAILSIAAAASHTCCDY